MAPSVVSIPSSLPWPPVCSHCAKNYSSRVLVSWIRASASLSPLSAGLRSTYRMNDDLFLSFAHDCHLYNRDRPDPVQSSHARTLGAGSKRHLFRSQATTPDSSLAIYHLACPFCYLTEDSNLSTCTACLVCLLSIPLISLSCPKSRNGKFLASASHSHGLAIQIRDITLARPFVSL